MKRKKVFYGYIQNESARKASLKKRKPGLLKKLEEVSILCGTKACGIIYSPNEEKPAFWPSELEVEQMLRQYEATPDLEKNNVKKLNQETYIQERVKKLQEQLKQLDSTNREMENSYYLHQIYRAGKTLREFLQTDLVNLKDYVEERRRAIERRRQFYHQVPGTIPDQEPVAEEETLIRDDQDPLTEQWYVHMMNRETQYEVGSSSNNAVNKKKAVVVSDHAAMSQGSNVISGGGGGGSDGTYDHQDPSTFVFNTMAGMYNGNPEGINNGHGVVLPPGPDNSGGGNNELGGATEGNNWVYNMNLHGQVVEGDDNRNAALYGWSRHDAGGSNVGNGYFSGLNINLYHWNNIGGYPNPSVGYKGSANVINQGSGIPIGYINENGHVGQGLYHGQIGGTNAHGTLHFPDNSNMFGARLPWSNLEDVQQPNDVPSTSYCYNVGGNGTDNMAQHPS